MKRYMLLLMIATTLLSASEAIKATISAMCYDTRTVLGGLYFDTNSRKEIFTLSLSSKNLNQSKDALSDNTGGYVDIPEEKFALISDKDTYRLGGSVELSEDASTYEFVCKVYNHSKTMINTKELYSLKNSKNLKLIQKINLKQKSNKINSVDIYFDESIFNQERKSCEEQIDRSRQKFYLQLALSVLVIFGLLYFILRRFKR